MKKILDVLMVIILTVLGAGIGLSSFYYLQGIIAANGDYPNLNQGNGFTMADADGQMHNSDKWIGQVILLNFWATWCPPCRKEIPGFVELYNNYHEKGLTIVGIAIDEPEKVKHFAANYNINYLNLVDEDKGMELVMRYGNHTGGLPYTVIINREGKVIFTRTGELAAVDAEKIIVPLLAK